MGFLDSTVPNRHWREWLWATNSHGCAEDAIAGGELYEEFSLSPSLFLSRSRTCPPRASVKTPLSALHALQPSDLLAESTFSASGALPTKHMTETGNETAAATHQWRYLGSLAITLVPPGNNCNISTSMTHRQTQGVAAELHIQLSL